MPYSPGALSNLNNPFSPQPATPVQCTEQEPIFNQVGQVNQFNPVVSEDPRSRHSSAGSDQAPRSAPLSPYNSGPAPNTRVRHQSAGGAIQLCSSTIHYRPGWQSNGEYSVNNEEMYQTTYTSSQPPTPSPMDQTVNQSPLEQSLQNQTFSYQQVGNTSVTVSSNYLNTGLEAEFGGNNDELNILMQGEMEGDEGGQARKEGDDLDLLSALRDCDTDFIFPEVDNSANN